MNTLAAMLSSKLNVEVEPPQHHSAVEYNAACQAELLNGPCKPVHLFGDINEFWRPEVLTALKDLRQKNMPLNRTTMLPLVKSGKATRKTGYCFRHRGMCKLKRCRDAWMGFPCISWSPQGPGGKDSGRDFEYFCAMASVTLDLED